MKYFFTTLAVNEPYFSKSVKFHQELHEKTEHAIFNITTTEKDLTTLIDHTGLTLENFKEKYPRIQITTIESFNKIFTFPLDQDSHGFIFNLNLKALSIKACVESDKQFDYLIFIDGDWHIGEEFSEDKIFLLFNNMETMQIDFAFERPAKIGDYKSNNYQDCFFMEKLNDYKVTDHNLWDEAHVVNEQFLAFKNTWKLRVFAQKWEQMLWYTVANNIRNYPDGFEIGVAALESKMTHNYYMFCVLTNCFYFYAKYTPTKYIKF